MMSWASGDLSTGPIPWCLRHGGSVSLHHGIDSECIMG